jgi:hypothetical protein
MRGMNQPIEQDAYAEFIRRIRSGDQDAAAELVRLYEPEIRLEVRTWLRLRDPRLRRVFDSMDICQSVTPSPFASFDSASHSALSLSYCSISFELCRGKGPNWNRDNSLTNRT